MAKWLCSMFLKVLVRVPVIIPANRTERAHKPSLHHLPSTIGSLCTQLQLRTDTPQQQTAMPSEMQPKTSYNYLFVVLLLGKYEHNTKAHTRYSSKFHNHSLVRRYWVPHSWPSSLSSLNETCVHRHARTKCNCTSLPTTRSLEQFASPACCEPGRCLFS